MASQEQPLHTFHPPTTIRHSSSLTHHSNDVDGRSATTSTRCGSFYAYKFGLNLVLVASPKALAPSPFTSSQKSCRTEQAGQIKRMACKGEFLAGCTVKGTN
jgi:hypothetical protein